LGLRRLLGGCFDELLSARPFDALVISANSEQTRNALLLCGERRKSGGANCSQVRDLDFKQILRLEFEQPSSIDACMGARCRLDAWRIQA